MTPGLAQLLDGRFPAGAHSHSAGVEAAVRAGDVADEGSLRRHLEGRLATTGVTDAAFATRACAGARDTALLDALDTEYSARVVSPRLDAVSRRLGRQLLRATRAVWPDERLDAVSDHVDGPHQTVALGVAVAVAGGDPGDAAVVTMHHLATAVTTAAVRLLGLDPLGVAAVQAAVAPLIGELAAPAPTWATAAPADLPAVGGALTELLGEDHATWDARLFVG